jgi:hypothetical protein
MKKLTTLQKVLLSQIFVGNPNFFLAFLRVLFAEILYLYVLEQLKGFV